MPLPIEGGVIGHYTLEEPLGEGGWAIVYRAVDLRLGRTVAIKILREAAFVQEADWGSLVREARLAASLAHPHICMIFDVDEDKCRTYIAMEYGDRATRRSRTPPRLRPAGMAAGELVIPTTRTVILRQHLLPRSVPNAVSPPGRVNDAGGSEIPRAPTAGN